MLVVGLGGFASETRPNKELDSVAVAAHFSSQRPIREREGGRAARAVGRVLCVDLRKGSVGLPITVTCQWNRNTSRPSHWSALNSQSLFYGWKKEKYDPEQVITMCLYFFPFPNGAVCLKEKRVLNIQTAIKTSGKRCEFVSNALL